MSSAIPPSAAGSKTSSQPPTQASKRSEPGSPREDCHIPSPQLMAMPISNAAPPMAAKGEGAGITRGGLPHPQPPTQGQADQQCGPADAGDVAQMKALRHRIAVARRMLA